MSADNAIHYTPDPIAREFIKSYLPGEPFHNWILGPVGSGKTTAMLFKIPFMAALQAPSPIDGIRRSKAVVVRNTNRQLLDTTYPSWSYWVKDGQAGTWKASENKFTLRFADVECEVLFRALDNPDDVARVLSLEVTFVVIDEFVQIRKEIVEALSGRAGRYPPDIAGGATNWGMWGASNAGEEDSWWYDYLVTNPLPDNAKLFEQPSGFLPTAENIQRLPGRENYYPNLAKGKSAEWVRQFIECKWGYSLAGRPVFPQFKPELHIASSPLKPNPGLPLVIGFDPGMHSALIIGQEDLHGRLLIYDELVQRDMGAERVITERLRPLLNSPRYANMQRPVIAPDPAAANRAQTDERSVVDVFKRHFQVKYDTNNTLAPRLSAMEHYLTRLTDAGPALLIDPGCKTLIRGMGGGYRYAVSTKGVTSASPEKNEWSHPADAACYLARHFRTADARSERNKGRPAFTPPTFGNSYTW